MVTDPLVENPLFDLELDYTKPIPPVPDEYLTWPGKDEGKPKPPILWLEGGGCEMRSKKDRDDRYKYHMTCSFPLFEEKPKPVIRIEKVIRIVRMGTWYKRILFWTIKLPLYGKAVVAYRHYVDGKGPYTCSMEPFIEPPEDSEALIKLWKACGSITTPGAKS